MEEEAGRVSDASRKALLWINCLLLAIGNCGAPLVLRLYYVKGGKRIWFASWLQTGGWPIILIPLIISYSFRCRAQGTHDVKLVLMKSPVFIGAAVIGILTGLDNYLYAYGFARLPVSTAAIVISSQLGFTALFAFLLVKQKFTAFSVNAIFLLTLGSGVLALHTSGDRPEGESSKLYLLGFLMTLAASALYGLIMPMVQLMYTKAKQATTYTLVLEFQLVMCFFATAFCTVGMLVNYDFQAIRREARAYELGETKYYLVVVWNAIAGQFFFLGAIGVISCASSLLAGIIIAVLLPVTEILGVIFFREKFRAEKGVALALSLWGFLSYFYGEIKHKRKSKAEEEMTIGNSQAPETMMTPITAP